MFYDQRKKAFSKFINAEEFFFNNTQRCYIGALGASSGTRADGQVAGDGASCGTLADGQVGLRDYRQQHLPITSRGLHQAYESLIVLEANVAAPNTIWLLEVLEDILRPDSLQGCLGLK